MLRLVALSALLSVVAAQIPTPSPISVLVNGGGVNTNGNLLGMWNKQMGGTPTALNGATQLTSGSTLGGTASLGTTPTTKPSTTDVLGGTASLGTTPTAATLTAATGNSALGGTVTVGTTPTASTTGSSSTGTVTSASAVGDPEIRGFDGKSFEFDGQVGNFYEALGGAGHQVSVNLKLGVMYDHNGTYIQGVGVRIHRHKIVVKLDANDKLQMLADSVPMAIPADSQSLNETLGSGPEAAHIDWRLFRVKYGNSVEISSALLTVRIYKTDAGVLDKGGVPQPAYLNFEMALNTFPRETLKGFMGETYNRAIEASKRKLQAGSEYLDKPFGYANNPELFSLPGFFT